MTVETSARAIAIEPSKAAANIIVNVRLIVDFFMFLFFYLFLMLDFLIFISAPLKEWERAYRF